MRSGKQRRTAPAPEGLLHIAWLRSSMAELRGHVKTHIRLENKLTFFFLVRELGLLHSI